MRERMDFSSISRIILDNRKADCLSNTEYYLTLFEYAFTQSEIVIVEPDDGIISRTIRGQRNVVKDILALYQQEENQKYLLEGVRKVLKDVADPDYVGEQLEHLLWNDSTISQARKKELSTGDNSIEQFVTGCLLFALSKNFISREESAEQDSKKNGFCLSDFLVDYRFPSVNNVFLGRERELKEIGKRLKETSCLFLEGIGGIGKSELAKQYGKRCKNQYGHVIFMRYEGSLQRTITELEFVDDRLDMSEDDLFRSHYRFFKQLPENVLVILDNFNTLPEHEELFHAFCSMPFTLLVTTRSHIEEVDSYLVEEMQELDDLLELFYNYAPMSRDNPSIVMDIIEEVYRHTLTVEMAAKTLTASCITLGELLSALRKEGVALSNPNKVKVTKDSRTKKERLYGHLQTLFQLQELDGLCKEILMNMALMSEKGIEKGLFHHWMQWDDFNEVNELVEYGWIQEDTQRYRISMHPFLREVVADSLKPSISKCGILLRGIFENCSAYGLDLDYYRDVISTLEMVFQYIEIDNELSAFLFMDRTLAYLEKYKRVDTMERILDIMEESIPMDKNHKSEWAVYLQYRGIVAHSKSDYQKAKNYYQEAIDILGVVNHVYAQIQNNLYHNLSSVYLCLRDLEKSWEFAEKTRRIREKYQLQFNQNGIVQKIHWALLLAGRGNPRKAVDILEKMEKACQDEPYFNTTMAEIYKGLGTAMSYISPLKAMEYLKKAKNCYLSHLSPEDERVKQLDFIMGMMRMDAQLLPGNGFIRLR